MEENVDSLVPIWRLKKQLNGRPGAPKWMFPAVSWWCAVTSLSSRDWRLLRNFHNPPGCTWNHNAILPLWPLNFQPTTDAPVCFTFKVAPISILFLICQMLIRSDIHLRACALLAIRQKQQSDCSAASLLCSSNNKYVNTQERRAQLFSELSPKLMVCSMVESHKAVQSAAQHSGVHFLPLLIWQLSKWSHLCDKSDANKWHYHCVEPDEMKERKTGAPAGSPSWALNLGSCDWLWLRPHETQTIFIILKMERIRYHIYHLIHLSFHFGSLHVSTSGCGGPIYSASFHLYCIVLFFVM